MSDSLSENATFQFVSQKSTQLSMGIHAITKCTPPLTFWQFPNVQVKLTSGIPIFELSFSSKSSKKSHPEKIALIEKKNIVIKMKSLIFIILSPFLLIEFKGEYKTISREIIPFSIHRPGESLKINIFNPRGENPKIHAEKIMNLLISCQVITFQDEYSAQMEKLFVEVLYKICSDPERRNWEGFDYYVKEIKNEFQSKFYNIQNGDGFQNMPLDNFRLISF